MWIGGGGFGSSGSRPESKRRLGLRVRERIAQGLEPPRDQLSHPQTPSGGAWRPPGLLPTTPTCRWVFSVAVPRRPPIAEPPSPRAAEIYARFPNEKAAHRR